MDTKNMDDDTKKFLYDEDDNIDLNRNTTSDK
jgi:hypothetical protein